MAKRKERPDKRGPAGRTIEERGRFLRLLAAAGWLKSPKALQDSVRKLKEEFLIKNTEDLSSIRRVLMLDLG